MKKTISISLTLLGLLTLGAVNNAAAQEKAAPVCAQCHEDQVASFAANFHTKAWAGKEDRGCQTCHGPTDEHIKAGGGKETIISFTKGSKQSAAEQSKQCLECHAKTADLMNWNLGKHKKNGVSCASCHSMHAGKAAVKPTAETCFGCHKDIKSQTNRLSHHPIVEGKVSCKDCHNPHGSPSHGMLRAENNNQLCYKCHSDKRGPFMWEHPPVEENCNTCHVPHGSQHRYLLNQKQPNLCQDCHTVGRHPTTVYDGSKGMAASTPSIQLVSRGCVNCHSRIHGSNAPHNPGKSAGYNSGKFFLK